jgi:transglutaminase-like putative cysteine protease
VYYFRQSALSQYNGRRLVRAARDDVDRDVFGGFAPARLALDVAPDAAGRVELRTTTGLLVEHLRPFALDAPTELQPAPNPSPARFLRTFALRSFVPLLPYEAMLGARAGRADWTPEQWQHYTLAPADPRYAGLARELVAPLRQRYADDPLARALAIQAYLERKGVYSRRSTHAGADDPAASFLFGDLTGYCVHFSHAAVYLMRSLGLPARVAVGYAVPESARAGGSAIAIRGLNAHAWPELYLHDIGWVVVDPTPEHSLDAAAPPPDLELQRRLGELLRQRPEATPEPSPLSARALGLRAAQAARAAAWLAALVTGASLLIGLYRRALPRFAPAHALPRVAYRAALDRLAALGVRRRRGETRERFAARARSLAPSFGALTDCHLRAALGRPEAAAVPEWLRQGTELRRELRARVPAWRRVLGSLHPFAWWTVH